METIRIRKGDEYAKHVAMISLCQINQRIATSWGISKIICVYVNEMPALGLLVNGFIHQGWVFVALNERTDTYELFTVENKDKMVIVVKKHIDDVYCDMLTDTIDGMIERDPSWSDEEYNSKVDKWLSETA